MMFESFCDYKWFDLELQPSATACQVIFEDWWSGYYLITDLEGQLLQSCTSSALANVSLELRVTERVKLHLLANMITVGDSALGGRLTRLEEMLVAAFGESDERVTQASRLVAVAKKMGWKPTLDRRVLSQPILVQERASNELRVVNHSSEIVHWRLVVGFLRQVPVV